MPKPPTPVYLVVLRDLETDEILRCECTRFLDTAIEQVFLHLVTNNAESPIKPEVAFDRDGELQGISFVDGSKQAHAMIGAYYLERETSECEYPELVEIAGLPARRMEAALSQFFNG